MLDVRKKRALVRVGSLPPQDLLMLLQIACLLGRFMMMRQVCSLPGLVRQFDAKPAVRRVTDARVPRLVGLTHALVCRMYGRKRCLPRSLVLFRFLRRWGYPVSLHIGMAPSKGAFAGHAWLELQGVPFAERSDPREVYKTMYAYPAPDVCVPRT